MLDSKHSPTEPAQGMSARPVKTCPVVELPSPREPNRPELMRPRSLLTEAQWQEWLTASGHDAALPAAALERLYDLERDLHWRDACGSAQLEGHMAFLEEETLGSNPYGGEPEDKEWDEDGKGYRSLRSSCALLWEMGWMQGEFNAQLDAVYDQLTSGDAESARTLLKQALKKHD